MKRKPKKTRRGNKVAASSPVNVTLRAYLTGCILSNENFPVNIRIKEVVPLADEIIRQLKMPVWLNKEKAMFDPTTGEIL